MIKAKEINQLANQIELNRQRLDHALKSQNESLQLRTLSLLTTLHALYFDLTKPEVFMKSNQSEKSFLVFSEANQDGQIMSLTEYRALVRSMDRCDRESHMAVEVGANEKSTLAVVLAEEAQIDLKKRA